MPLEDGLICEAVARLGGYEEVDTQDRWASIAGALGYAKSQATRIKQRYEDMLKSTAELEEEEEEEADRDYEVEDILDSRIGENGRSEYLVKWKGYEEGGEDEAQTWEPLSHLEGAQELLQRFERRRRQGLQSRQRQGAGGEEGAPSGAGAKRDRLDYEGYDKEVDGPAVNLWERVTKVKRNASTGYNFIVLCSDGSEIEMTRQQLRDQAPLLLLDFYEVRNLCCTKPFEPRLRDAH